MKTFILNIYKKDSRTKSGRRICGSYEFERKDEAAMQREVKELKHLYRERDGYSFVIIDATNNLDGKSEPR